MRHISFLALALLGACEGYEYPNFGSVSPNTLDSGDTADEGEPLDIEGQPWIYTGTIPGEDEAGVTCTEDECERCVLLQDGAVSISFRPIGGTAQDWTTVQYGSYHTSSGSSYVVDLRWNWSAVSADGLATANEGHIVISEAQGAASDYTTLGIGVCPE